MNKPTPAPDEFVRAWQTSATLAEVVQKTGLHKSSCYSRAAFYRRKGVPLKRIVKQRTDPYPELAELAKSLENLEVSRET